jgi:hypothetical protein
LFSWANRPKPRRGGFGRRAFLSLLAGYALSPAAFRQYAFENNNLADLNIFSPYEYDFAFKAETACFLLKS